MMPVFAQTSPVYLTMPGRTPAPAEASVSAAALLEQLSYMERWAFDRARLPTAENKAEALGLLQQARAKYGALVAPRP